MGSLGGSGTRSFQRIPSNGTRIGVQQEGNGTHSSSRILTRTRHTLPDHPRLYLLRRPGQSAATMARALQHIAIASRALASERASEPLNPCPESPFTSASPPSTLLRSRWGLIRAAWHSSVTQTAPPNSRLDYDPDHRWYALETAGAIARAARLELPSECAPHQRVLLVLDCIRETCGSLAHPILRLR